jgi:1-acyl-sn-glycerol-3-phosphate acyltransferase
LDSVLIGVACRRAVRPLARESLFRNRFFGWLIGSLGAIPIDRDGFGLAGLKATLRTLKAGEVVLVFGEGTRSKDGALQPLKPGFCTLARRAKVPILPVAINGAYDAMPRSSKFPRPSAIQVRFGEPLLVEQYESLTDDELLGETESRIRVAFRVLQEV